MTVPNSKRLPLVTGSAVLKYQLHLVPTSSYTLLEDAADVAWEHAVTAEVALTENACRGYDAPVFFCFFQELSEMAIDHLRAFMQAGKGILVVHSGPAPLVETDTWPRDVVGVRYHHGETADHPKTGSFPEVKQTMRPSGEHPVNCGLAPFELGDEAHKGLEFLSPITMLIETDYPASDGAIAWIGPSTDCRTVVLEPGHTEEPFLNQTHREIV